MLLPLLVAIVAVALGGYCSIESEHHPTHARAAVAVAAPESANAVFDNLHSQQIPPVESSLKTLAALHLPELVIVATVACVASWRPVSAASRAMCLVASGVPAMCVAVTHVAALDVGPVLGQQVDLQRARYVVPARPGHFPR